jgi:hypothetical protein
VDEIANKIIAVLSYPALSREMLHHGKSDLKTVRWSIAAERILTVYKQLTR